MNNVSDYAPNDSGLPGGTMRDKDPLNRGDGSWEWGEGRGPHDGLSQTRAQWHEDDDPESGGWYATIGGKNRETMRRIGPLRDAFNLADGLRDLFPAPAGATGEDLEYYEGLVDGVIRQALVERVVTAARTFAEKSTGPPEAGRADPAALLERIQKACDDRRAWHDC